MDRRFKERLIGAVVLACAAVLILPAVLNGPHAPVPDPEQTGETAMHSETIELGPRPRSRFAPADPDPAATDRESPARGPAMPGSEPSPAGEAPEAGASDAAATATGGASPPKAESSPPPAPERDATADLSEGAPTAQGGLAAPTGEGWAVQVGTFASSTNATALAASLKARGYAAFVAPVASGGKSLYRVRVGPTADIEAARALEQRLEKEGQKGDVVRQP